MDAQDGRVVGSSELQAEWVDEERDFAKCGTHVDVPR